MQGEDTSQVEEAGSLRLDNKAFFTSARLSYIGCVLLAATCYWRSLQFEQVWGDSLLLSGVAVGGGKFWPALTQPLLGHYFRPVPSLSYWLDLQLYGSTSFLWHQTSILLHAFAVLLVGALAQEATKRPWAGVLAALVFAVQPAQVAATSWLGARADLLSVIFFSSFLLSLLKYLKSNQWGWLVATSLSLLACLLTKEQNIVVLLTVPATYWWVHGRSTKQIGSVVFAYALPTLLFVVGCVASWRFAPQATPPSLVLMPFDVGATACHYVLLLSGLVSGTQATTSLGNYVGSPAGVVGWVVLGALVAGTVVGVRRRSLLGWAGLVGLSLYLPNSNIIPLADTLVAPQRVALIGVMVAIVLGTTVQESVAAKKVALGVVSAAVAVIGAFTAWMTVPLWRSEPELLAHMSRHDPWSSIARNVAVANAVKAKEFEEAVHLSDGYLDWSFKGVAWRKHVTDGIKLPVGGNYSARLWSGTRVQGDTETNLATLLTNRAAALFGLGSRADALASVKSALILKPDYGPSLLCMADIVSVDDKVQAIALYQKAAKLMRSGPAYVKLAQTLEETGDHASAARAYQEALKIASWMGDVWVQLAEVEVKIGQYYVARDAIETARKKAVFDQGKLEKVAREVEALGTRLGLDTPSTGGTRP